MFSSIYSIISHVKYFWNQLQALLVCNPIACTYIVSAAQTKASLIRILHKYDTLIK